MWTTYPLLLLFPYCHSVTRKWHQQVQCDAMILQRSTACWSVSDTRRHLWRHKRFLQMPSSLSLESEVSVGFRSTSETRWQKFYKEIDTYERLGDWQLGVGGRGCLITPYAGQSFLCKSQSTQDLLGIGTYISVERPCCSASQPTVAEEWLLLEMPTELSSWWEKAGLQKRSPGTREVRPSRVCLHYTAGQIRGEDEPERSLLLFPEKKTKFRPSTSHD